MTTYYVNATDGDDSKDGQSRANAWQTISKVNAEFVLSTFNPADSILFERGETWLVTGGTTRLRPLNCSGTDGNPITVGACGGGNRPRLDANGSPYHCIHREDGDAAADYITIQDLELTGTDHTACMKVYDAANWIIDNLYIHDITSEWCCGLMLRESSNMMVQDGTIANIQGEGMYLGTSGDFSAKLSDVTVKRYDISNCWNNGIDMKSGCERINVVFCTLTDTGWYEVMSIGCGGIQNFIYGNHIKQDGHTIDQGIYMGVYYAQLAGITATEHVVIRNFLEDIGADIDDAGIWAYGEGDEIRCNQFDGCSVGLRIDSCGLDAGGSHKIFGSQFLTNTRDVRQSSAKYTCDYGRYADADCVWYYNGANRNLAYVQGTLGKELHASTSVDLTAGDVILPGDQGIHVATWLPSESLLAFLAADGTAGEAVCLRHSECDGLNETQINSLLSDLCANFDNLSAVVDQLSPLRIKATWQP